MSGTMPGAVIVLESAGVIGRGLVVAALGAGHPVLVVDRRPAVIADLGGAAGLQVPQALVRGSARSEAEARVLAAELRALDQPLAGLLAAVDAGSLRAHWPSALEIGQHAARCGCSVPEFPARSWSSTPTRRPSRPIRRRPRRRASASASLLHASESEPMLLPAGCLQDVRKLLGRFDRTGFNRTRVNQEAFPQ